MRSKKSRAEGGRSDPFFHDKPTEEESLLFVGHVGVLLTAEDGTLHFVEKVAFQEPYRMLRFADRTALSDYLMGKYDTSWGQDTASPFIMENAAPELRAKFPNHCRRVEDVLRTL